MFNRSIIAQLNFLSMLHFLCLYKRMSLFLRNKMRSSAVKEYDEGVQLTLKWLGKEKKEATWQNVKHC